MARRRAVGVYPHGSGWKFQIKDLRTGKWRQVVATRGRFAAVGLSLRSDQAVTKSDALRLKQRYEERLAQAEVLQVPDSEIRLTRATADYLEFQRNAPAYLKDKKRVLREFSEICGDRPLAGITKDQLQAFEMALREEGRGLHPTSVARYLRYVRTFFNYCVREGWIIRSPFANFRVPKDESTPIEVFSLKELGTLVTMLRTSWDGGDRDYGVWMVCGFVGLGLRVMELQALDWEDFDPNERFVHISTTKNIHSRRPQPVPRCLMPFFKARQQESGPMFPTLGGERANRNQMASLGRRIAARSPGFSWQRLRRTYATLLQAGGVDALIIDRLLGHSSRSSTIRVSASHYIGKEYGFYRGLVDAALKPLARVFVGSCG